MSITIGFYDFFSYTVPGLLYLYTINKFLEIINFPYVSLEDISLDIWFAIIGVVLSYIVGALLDTFAYRWYLLFHKNKVEQRVIDNFKKYYPDLKVDFAIHDRRLAFSFIRHNNLELAENIDKFKALSIMLQNISFGLLLFSVVQIIKLILGGYSDFVLVSMLITLIFSYVAIHRSALFNFWYWSGNFEQALHYGKSVSEMFSQYEQNERENKNKSRHIKKK